MAPNKVAIVYGTFFMGNSENDANVIAKEFPADKFPGLELLPPTQADAFDFNTLKDCKFLVLVLSSQIGMPPPNFLQFAHQLVRAAENPAKPLKHLQHAVWANGDETYFKTYMNAPRSVDKLLEQAGSRRFYARGEKGEPFADLDADNLFSDEWSSPMWEAATKADAAAAPVAWDALWAKQKSEYHMDVKVFDAAALDKREKYDGKVSFAVAAASKL